MSKAGQSILRGAKQALAYVRGERAGYVVHVPETVDVRAIRRHLGRRRLARRNGSRI